MPVQLNTEVGSKWEGWFICSITSKDWQQCSGADQGGEGSWGGGPPLLGNPQTSYKGKKRCAHACENAAF